MLGRRWSANLIILAAALLFVACAGAGTPGTAEPPPGPTEGQDPSEPVSSDTPSPRPPTPTEPDGAETVSGKATVESVELYIMESFPVQVRATVKGTLQDGCTSIDQITTEREANTFWTTITTSRPVDALCTEALVPFEESFPLEVEGLKAGTYTVDVNGVSATFTLDIDNTLSEEPASIDIPVELSRSFCFDGERPRGHGQPLGFAAGSVARTGPGAAGQLDRWGS